MQNLSSQESHAPSGKATAISHDGGRDFVWSKPWVLAFTNGQQFASFSNITAHLQAFRDHMSLTLNYDYVSSGWRDIDPSDHPLFSIDFKDSRGETIYSVTVGTQVQLELATRCNNKSVHTGTSALQDYFSQTDAINLVYRGGSVEHC